MILDFLGILQDLVMVLLKNLLEIFGFLVALTGTMLGKLGDQLDLKVLKD
jgi:hypothetical protein